MERTTVHLTTNQKRFIRRESKLSGLKTAEIFRRAIDEYLERRKEERAKQ